MRFCSLILVLASCLALAQTKTNPPAAPAAAGAAANSSPEAKKELAPDAAVITVKGLCTKQPPAGGECNTIITKQQFDVLADALFGTKFPQGGVPDMSKRNLAKNWATVLVLSSLAEKDGLLKQPRTQALIQFGQQQAEAQEEARTLQKGSVPTDAEVRKVYDGNKDKQFWETQVERIAVPAKGEGDKGADEATMKAFTQEILKRAKAGEPFEKLQKEAFDKAGLENPVQVNLTIHSDMLPPEMEKSVRDTKVGEIGTTSDPSTGTQIFKVIKTEYIPFEKVEDKVRHQLQQERTQQSFESVINAHPADLNPDYFGPEPPPSPAAPMGR